MEKNTVLISREDYDRLKETKRLLEEFIDEEFIFINRHYVGSGILTKDKAVKELTKSVKELDKLYNKCQRENSILIKALPFWKRKKFKQP